MQLSVTKKTDGQIDKWKNGEVTPICQSAYAVHKTKHHTCEL